MKKILKFFRAIVNYVYFTDFFRKFPVFKKMEISCHFLKLRFDHGTDFYKFLQISEKEGF